MRELGIVDHGSVKVKLYLRLLLGGGFDALMDLDPFALAFALVRRGFPRGPRSFELGLKLTERRAGRVRFAPVAGLWIWRAA